MHGVYLHISIPDVFWHQRFQCRHEIFFYGVRGGDEAGVNNSMPLRRLSKTADRVEYTVEQSVGIGRTSRNIGVNRDDVIHAAERSVIFTEDAAAAPAGADCN